MAEDVWGPSLLQVGVMRDKHTSLQVVKGLEGNEGILSTHYACTCAFSTAPWPGSGPKEDTPTIHIPTSPPPLQKSHLLSAPHLAAAAKETPCGQ